MVKLDEKQHYKTYKFQSKPVVSPNLNAPPKLIDICNVIGLSDRRLYFNVKQFPVTNINDAETMKYSNL